MTDFKPDKLGAVIIFDDHITKEQAAAALAKIADVLDLPDSTVSFKAVENPEFDPDERDPEKRSFHPFLSSREVSHPFEFSSLVNEFDSRWGGPVWYIP